jgi:hypothetical protein
LKLAKVPAINALTSVTELLSGGTLQMYSGPVPSSPQTALTNANTLLATFTFAAPGFVAVAGHDEQQTAVFESASVPPLADGLVTFARAKLTAFAWAASTSYKLGQFVITDDGIYRCVKAGTSASRGSGPVGRAAAITDGNGATAIWGYYGPARAFVVADFSVGVSDTDIVIADLALSPQADVTINDFILSVPNV